MQLEGPFTFRANKTFALRIYPDSRPKNMEIASLQKGLVLLVDGSEVIEEGAGFGVPVLKYSDKTFFSKTASVFVKEQDDKSALIVKVFSLDSVSKKQVQGTFINDSFYTVIHKIFEKAYLTQGKMRPIFDWIMRLRKTMGVETFFAQVPSRGNVIFYYHCFSDHIKVCADFSNVDLSLCREILILNEQGASFFRKIRNNKIVMQDQQIGALVKNVSEFAQFSDLKGHISFSIDALDNADLYYGREQVRDRFSWAGIIYVFSPKTLTFNYIIRLKEKIT